MVDRDGVGFVTSITGDSSETVIALGGEWGEDTKIGIIPRFHQKRQCQVLRVGFISRLLQ